MANQPSSSELRRRSYRADVRAPAKELDEEHVQKSKFQFGIWLLLAAVNWILDFGRPIAMLAVPLKYSPLSLPSIGDYFHMMYNVVTPLCLLKLVERAPRRVSTTLVNVAVIFFVMGASIHLVADSVNHRLVHSGYQLHLSVAENPIMKQLKPRTLVDSFQLLYFFDEQFGHIMWYVPFFIVLVLYFNNSFVKKSDQDDKSESMNLHAKDWVLSAVSALYYWYLVTEGQIFPLFLVSLVAMAVMKLLNERTHGLAADANAKFLLYTFLLALVLVVLWVGWLWNDKDMRNKYPGWLYVPEPWAFYSSRYMMKQ